MLHRQIQSGLWFVGLVLLQVLILNNIHLFACATPFLYVYFILRCDTGISRNNLLLLAFLLGIIIDVFSNTAGINASATVFLAFSRPFILKLFVPRDAAEAIVPALKTLGNSSYLKYLIVSVFLHHFVLFSVMFFSFADIHLLMLKVVASTLLTALCIIGIEWMRR